VSARSYFLHARPAWPELEAEPRAD
jgi:hypothetical protein